MSLCYVSALIDIARRPVNGPIIFRHAQTGK
jgi:hypothetical protein